MPRYIIDVGRLRANLETLGEVGRKAGAKILLAQKAYSCAATYPLCAKYLAGTTASSLHEARHGYECFGGETHIFSPAYDQAEMDEILSLVDHIVFNSPRQVRLYAKLAKARGVSTGLRVNPEVSVATTSAYDPCRASSRLGTTRAVLDASGMAGEGELPIDGLHFHCLCEQGVDELQKVLAGFEEKFGFLIPGVKWVNFGGGHHITRAGYDVEALVRIICDFRRRYPGVEVYIEPGEAIALDAGFLEAHILEIQPQGADGISNVILDTSAACHMPDVIEMPYTPRVTGAKSDTSGPYVYRFGGPTCLAGDEIGIYSFDHPLDYSEQIVFEDMAIYSMVKNNTFNGVRLPEIWLREEDGSLRCIRSFGYDDFASRLG